MSAPELPPLPVPFSATRLPFVDEDFYTADQMHAYARAALEIVAYIVRWQDDPNDVTVMPSAQFNDWRKTVQRKFEALPLCVAPSSVPAPAEPLDAVLEPAYKALDRIAEDPNDMERRREAEVYCFYAVQRYRALKGGDTMSRAESWSDEQDRKDREARVAKRAVSGLTDELRKVAGICCHQCDYEEADGSLFNHCDTCCRAITTKLCEIVNRETR